MAYRVMFDYLNETHLGQVPTMEDITNRLPGLVLEPLDPSIGLYYVTSDWIDDMFDMTDAEGLNKDRNGLVEISIRAPDPH